MKGRLFGLVFLIAALVLIYVPAHAQDEEERCFEETGFCISGRIRTYWEENGGLAVFGYPIGPQQEEEVEGELRQVQRFERNRLELHPENDPPYDVLLGRLSEERLLQLDRVWQDEPRQEGPQDGCLWFEETSLNVCDEEDGIGFRSYWEANGLQDPELDSFAQSLALFGLPLTPPQTETNSSGDTVLTMWFERARFEIHPDNPEEFRVLLGLLGNEIRDEGAETEPYPAPAPAPEPEEPTPDPEVPEDPAPAPEPEEPTPDPEEPEEPTPDPEEPSAFEGCQADPDPASAPNAPIQIVTVVKDAEPEVVQLQNVSEEEVNLDGWLMCSIDGDQEHTGISGTLEPNETRDFPYVGTGTIWDNEARDDGALYNTDGELISYWSDE